MAHSNELAAVSTGKSSDRLRHGKRTQKLLVYLDQNFLSDIAKTGTEADPRPEFVEIYELLRQGVVDEKLVVPGSALHDIESSLATHLKDRIVACQHRLGLVHLYRPDEIEDAQISATLDRFLGHGNEDPLDPDHAFIDNPDERIALYGISVDSHLETRNFRQSRRQTATDLEALRQRLLPETVTYEQQLQSERQAQRDEFLRSYLRFFRPRTEETIKELKQFTESDVFAATPLLRIQAHLFASILTTKPTREIKSSDSTDIAALSAYAPYMDVVCTDAFMADQIRNIAVEFGITLFHAKTPSLRALIAFLQKFLAASAPIRRPSITVFVLPPNDHRERSFEFFRQLGTSLKAMGTREYGQIYAFDNGAMPQYEFQQMPGHPIPFYGLQDVARIDLPNDATEQDILLICRTRCRSEHFVLIDEYRTIPDTFMLGAAMQAEANLEFAHGYRIFKKISD
jgi:hypothetical protein